MRNRIKRWTGCMQGTYHERFSSAARSFWGDNSGNCHTETHSFRLNWFCCRWHNSFCCRFRSTLFLYANAFGQSWQRIRCIHRIFSIFYDLLKVWARDNSRKYAPSFCFRLFRVCWHFSVLLSWSPAIPLTPQSRKKLYISNMFRGFIQCFGFFLFFSFTSFSGTAWNI